MTGLPALEQGIRGPTLALTMPPDHAPDAIMAMTTYWIGSSNMIAVIAIVHHVQDDGGHLLKGLIARSADDEVRQRISALCRDG